MQHAFVFPEAQPFAAAAHDEHGRFAIQQGGDQQQLGFCPQQDQAFFPGNHVVAARAQRGGGQRHHLRASSRARAPSATNMPMPRFL